MEPDLNLALALDHVWRYDLAALLFWCGVAIVGLFFIHASYRLAMVALFPRPVRQDKNGKDGPNETSSVAASVLKPSPLPEKMEEPSPQPGGDDDKTEKNKGDDAKKAEPRKQDPMFPTPEWTCERVAPPILLAAIGIGLIVLAVFKGCGSLQGYGIHRLAPILDAAKGVRR